jgi:GrpB-like predicted nucleotidyltransferase (UPF0157 family)
MPPTPVRVVEHDPAWASRFADERARLLTAFGPLPAAIEHVGSTAVPGLVAKPILDLLVGRPPGDVAPYVEALQRAGYVWRGEAGIPGRHYFRRGDPRTHHLHLVERGGAIWRDHLAFRDRLRADAALAAAYGALKQRLARLHADDRAAYTEAKAPFIAAVLRGDAPSRPHER